MIGSSLACRRFSSGSLPSLSSTPSTPPSLKNRVVAAVRSFFATPQSPPSLNAETFSSQISQLEQELEELTQIRVFAFRQEKSDDFQEYCAVRIPLNKAKIFLAEGRSRSLFSAQEQIALARKALKIASSKTHWTRKLPPPYTT